jgi:hypothetical protein
MLFCLGLALGNQSVFSWPAVQLLEMDLLLLGHTLCCVPAACPSALPFCSIRFSLLSTEEQLAVAGSLAGPRGGIPLASVQLRSRHWIIRDASGAVDNEVRGEAVVGHYPLLRAGAV